jgi:hypothetical protein
MPPNNNIRKPDVLRDIDAYPILTEEVGYPPSPLATPSGTTPSVPGSAPLGQIAAKAVADVLSWKLKAGDVKGFTGALRQSFSLTEAEGHVQATWTPRTYAVQTDLSGGITGAQASVYTRAKQALDQALPLLDGLYTLNSGSEPEDVVALKAVVNSQFTELVNELGYLGGPRISRVNQYFQLLLGTSSFQITSQTTGLLNLTDPDQVEGTLGNLRDELGLSFTNQDFVNSIADEQNLSNFRVLSDYVTSLAQSWLNNLPFFGLDPAKPFFGTQLVLLSRQLSVVSEAVDEVRFTLDSVFIGPAERQTLKLKFSHSEPSMFAEDLFTWIQSFSSEEGPRLIQDGGKYAVQNTFFPVSRRLRRLVADLHGANPNLPQGFHTARVQRALRQLDYELGELTQLARPIRHDITPDPDSGLPLAALSVTGVRPDSAPAATQTTIAVLGTGFEFGGTPLQAAFTPSAGSGGTAFQAASVYFRSENCLAATIPAGQTPGVYDVTVTNADGRPSRPLTAALTVE